MKKDHRGKWEFKNDPNFQNISDDDRHWAMERALLIGKLLLDENAFTDVVKAINSGNQTHLNNALISVNLKDQTDPTKPDQTIRDWLWNYLKNYQEGNNWTGTGW
jgi:hypothetical protein